MRKRPKRIENGILMDEKPINTSASIGQMAYGIALTLMGLAVFFRVDVALGRLSGIAAFQSNVTLAFAKFCFYLMGVILVGGGIKKIIAQYNLLKKKDTPSDGEA